MKYFFTSVIFFFISHLTWGQNSPTYIALLDAVVNSNNYIENTLNTRLNQKVKSIFTKQKNVVRNSTNAIVIVPELNIINEQILNPGTQTLYTIDAELTFSVRSSSLEDVINTITQKIQGVGRSKELAISNLISNIPTEDVTLIEFVKETKGKALQYYAMQCKSIVEEALLLSNQTRFEEALSLLNSIPIESSCYGEVNPKIWEIFEKYQKRDCSKWLVEAKTFLANNQYAQGFEILSYIDPTSPCAAEVKEIINREAKEIDTERLNLKEWAYLVSINSAKIGLAKYKADMLDKLLFHYASTYPYYPPIVATKHSYQYKIPLPKNIIKTKNKK